jgi:CHASE3 domain sensor protein
MPPEVEFSGRSRPLDHTILDKGDAAKGCYSCVFQCDVAPQSRLMPRKPLPGHRWTCDACFRLPPLNVRAFMEFLRRDLQLERGGELRRPENPHKLMAVFAVMLSTIAVMGVTLFVNQTEYSEASVERTERAYESLRAADTAAFRLTRQENSLRGFLLSGDDYYVKRLEEAHKPKFLAALDELRTLAAGDQARSGPDRRRRRRLCRLSQEGHRAGRDPGRDPATRPQAVELVKHDGVADKAVSPVEDAIEAIQEFRSRARHRGRRPEEGVAGGPPGPGDRHRITIAIALGGGLLLSSAIAASGRGHDRRHAPPGLGRQRRRHPGRRPQGRDRPDGRRRRHLQGRRDRQDPLEGAEPPTSAADREPNAPPRGRKGRRGRRRRRRHRRPGEAWTAWPTAT